MIRKSTVLTSFAAIMIGAVCCSHLVCCSLAVAQAAVVSNLPQRIDFAPNAWNCFGHNRGWKDGLDLSDRAHLRSDWQLEVGDGYSQVVGNQSTVFVTSGSASKIADSKSKKLTTELKARSILTGEELWAFGTESIMTDEQETFGGNKPSPRSTPLLVGNRIVFWTFTGELFCLDATTGKQLWLKEPVQQLDAQKVQFGFSSSPVVCPDNTGEFVVLAAGKRGGLIRMAIETGKYKWISPVATFSYATPVFAKLNGVPQWIVVSRDEVAGISHADGTALWRFDLKEKGLTNVPSPLVVDDSTIVISGQGIKGTRCIDIERNTDNWTTNERWSGSPQFFYTNWLMMNDSVLLGCTEQYLTAFDCVDGSQLGRWRGFSNGNVIQIGDRFVVLNGKGDLSVMSYDSQAGELVVGRKYEIGKGRFWVAPSVIGERLLIRFDDRLHCYSFSKSSSKNDLTNQITKDKQTRLKFAKTASPDADPVAAIFSEFEKNGQQSAMTLYAKLRKQKKLSAEQRIAIAESAYDQGLKQVANLVMQHAKKDLPNSVAIKEKLAQWSR